MIKNRTLKYIILIFMFVVSFFAFSNRHAEAVTFVDTSSNINLELEENSGEYTIVGASATASAIDGWVMPSEYDSKPIVAIRDGVSDSVLSGIANVVSGKISIGSNIKNIGDYAFKNFVNIEEIDLSSSVLSIGENAFSGCELLKILKVSRYEISGTQYTTIDGSGTAGLNNNVKIVFPNSDTMNNYETNAGWHIDLKAKFTYQTTITMNNVFPNTSDTYSTGVVYGYYKYSLGDVIFDGLNLKDDYKLTFLGFDFNGWYSSNLQVNKDTVIMGNMTLYPKWEIKDFENVEIATYYLNESHSLVKYQTGDTSVTYGNFTDGLNLKVSYSHELRNAVSIKYEWYKQIVSYFYKVSSDEILNVKNVDDSASYKGIIEISYAGKDGNNNDYTYVKSLERQIVVNITKRNLVVNVNDNSTEYGTYVGPENIDGNYYTIESSTSLAVGEVINEEDVVVENTFADEYKNANVYNEALRLSINKIMKGNVDVTSNYNITYNYGTLTVNPKNVSLNLLENREIEYGDTENITRTVSYVIYGNEENVLYTFSRENSSNKDVGRYSIIGVTANNSNYNVSLDSTSGKYLIINPKKVTVVWDVLNNLVYDGTVKSAAAKYEDNLGAYHTLNIIFVKDGEETLFRNAGEYTLKAEMVIEDDNYMLYTDAEITRTIEKANTVISGAERQTKTYNSYNQYVDVSVNHYEGIIKQKYSQRLECKNVTVNVSPCVVIAYVDETDNYKAASRNFNLYIEPYSLTVEPNVFEIEYGRVIASNDLAMPVSGVNGETIIVYFATSNVSGFRNVGEYDIVGVSYTTSANYIASMVDGSGENKLHIIPMPLTVEFYYYENLVYDGNVKNIGIRVFGTEVDKDTIGLQVNYGDKPIQNAGRYTINVSLTNPNYVFTNSTELNFAIAKARYNIEGLKLEDKKVGFNFGSHFINLQGNLPSGLKAEYTIDGHNGNGTAVPFKHTVKVTFVGDFDNYVYVEPMTATLNISMAWIFITLGSIVLGSAAIVVSLYFLIKNKKLVIVKRISRRRIRRVIKKNKELDSINELIKSSANSLYKEEENIQIEEPVKFVKNTVYVQKEENAISLSFVDKLFQSVYGTKQFYSEVKNELLSYEGIVSKIKRDYETFYLNNIPVAKLDIVDGKLNVYLALDPEAYKKEEYNHENVSKDKMLATVPLKLVVNSIVSLRHAKMFVRIIRKREGIKAVSNFVRTDYAQVYTAKENTFKLFKKSRVKKESEMED